MDKTIENEYKKTIKKCKNNLNKVFKIYIDLINSIFSWENFIEYQNILAETLYEEKKQEIPLRRILKKIRNGLDKTNNEKEVQKKIEGLEAIEKSIKIFGDFLAWIFYMNNGELIEKHLEREKIGMHSIGSGVVAEIETVKRLNTPQNPQFYLYNELSSFLRIGDLSVFDKCTGRIIGFAEIKAGKPENNKMDVSIEVIVNNSKIYVPEDLNPKENNGHNFLEEHMIEHLNKQIEVMKNSLIEKKKYDKKLEKEINLPHYKELESLINQCYRNGFSEKKVSNDILYLSVRNNNDNISFNEKFDKGNVIKILNKKNIKGQNQLIIGELKFLTNGKNIPALVFPISNSAKKKMLNQTIFIVFNYNSVIDYYNEKGFEVIYKKKKAYLYV